MRLTREKIQLFVLVQVVLAGVLKGLVAPTRVKRGIFGTVTSTVVKLVEERHFVPASCVHIAPNLPECRRAKFMSSHDNRFKFFNFGNELFGIEDRNDVNVTPASRATNDKAKISTTETILGWGEYFGLYRPTITVTQLKIQPTTVLDPRIMVTYDIRGCKPHQLPFALQKCVDDSSLELAEIVPTTTVRHEIKPTKLPEPVSKAPEDLHGSEIEREQDNWREATTNL